MRWDWLRVWQKLQWGHGAGAVGILSHFCRHRPERLLQWGHGAWAVGMAIPDPAEAYLPANFNGATALGPWECHRYRCHRPRSSELQWGHGAGAVGIRDLLDGEIGPGCTSMGPRRWGRGNLIDRLKQRSG